MNNLIKLNSLNVWVDETGVYQPNEDGTPNIEDVKLYEDINPDWFDTEAKQMEYLTLVNKVCEPIENDIKNEKKIIKNIGKEIILNKETEKLLMLK